MYSANVDKSVFDNATNETIAPLFCNTIMSLLDDAVCLKILIFIGG